MIIILILKLKIYKKFILILLDELNKMINYYRIHKAVPRQVAGDDTQAGYYNGGYSSTGGMDYNRIDR